MYLPNLIENSDRKVFGRPAEVLHPPAEVLSGRRRRPPGGPTKRQKFSDNYVTNMSPNRARPNDALAARGPRFRAHPVAVPFLRGVGGGVRVTRGTSSSRGTVPRTPPPMREPEEGNGPEEGNVSKGFCIPLMH